MSVFALFCALLFDQFRPLQSHHRLYGVMRTAASQLRRHLDADTPAQAWLIWVLVVVVPAALVGLLYFVLGYFLGGFFAFLCSLFVLYTCLDFRAFSVHFTEVRNAVNTGDMEGAQRALGRWCTTRHTAVDDDTQASTVEGAADLSVGVVKTSLEHMHRYVFGVFAAFLLLSFLGLGPVGAVLFRSAAHAYRFWFEREDDHWPDRASPALAEVARAGWQFVNWLPARITALMFAAVGRYDEAITAWRSTIATAPMDGDRLVLTTGASAMGMEPRGSEQVAAWPQATSSHTRASEEAEDKAAEAMPYMLHTLASMIWRVLVLWLLICLVIGLIDAVL